MRHGIECFSATTFERVPDTSMAVEENTQIL
jgi:hypothetical protein